jgi:hypothetical protein
MNLSNIFNFDLKKKIEGLKYRTYFGKTEKKTISSFLFFKIFPNLNLSIFFSNSLPSFILSKKCKKISLKFYSEIFLIKEITIIFQKGIPIFFRIIIPLNFLEKWFKFFKNDV